MSYAPSQATRAITVEKTPTLMGVDQILVSQWAGVPFNASGHLWEGQIGRTTPMPGETVHVDYTNPDGSIRTSVGDAVTLADGSWSILVTIPTAGDYRIRADYDGDATHQSTWGNIPVFSVQAPVSTALTIGAPSSVQLNEEFTVSGVLTRLDTGAGVPSETIYLSYNATNIGSVVTDATGNYSFTLSIPTLGSYMLKVEYLGSGTLGLGVSIASIGIIAGEVSFFDMMWAYFVELMENLQLPIPEKPPSPPPLPFESE